MTWRPSRVILLGAGEQGGQLGSGPRKQNGSALSLTLMGMLPI